MCDSLKEDSRQKAMVDHFVNGRMLDSQLFRSFIPIKKFDKVRELFRKGKVR